MFERSEFCTMMIVHYLLFGFFLCLDGLADRNRREKSINSAAEEGRCTKRDAPEANLFYPASVTVTGSCGTVAEYSPYASENAIRNDLDCKIRSFLKYLQS